MKYVLSPSSYENRAVFSFKATAQLLQALENGQCTIQFDSESCGCISAGEEVFNVVHSESIITVCIICFI